MTELEALKNTFTAIQGLRTLRNDAPQAIALLDAEGKQIPVKFGNWSKSAINDNSQPVFLILQDEIPDEYLNEAGYVLYGHELWKITSRKSPAESKKAYWLLSVVECEEMENGRRKRSESGSETGKESRSDLSAVHNSEQSCFGRGVVSTW